MKSFLKIRVGIFLSLGMGALLCVCSFEEPAAPVWDVPVQIPVVNQMYTLEDLAEDADQLTVDPVTQNVIFNLEQDIESRRIGQFLKISGGGKMTTVNMPPNGFAGDTESKWDSLSIPDSIRVASAVLERGRLDIRLNNRSTYRISVAIEVLSLHMNGIPFRIEVDLPQGELITTRSLDGYAFTPDENNLIPYSMNIRILETYGNQGGELDVSVEVSNLAFREVTGIFDEIHVGFDEKIMDVNIPDMLEDFRLGSVDLKMALRIGYRIPIRIRFLIEALETLRDEAVDPFLIDTVFTPQSRDVPDTLRLPDITDLINSQPGQIRVTGSITLGWGTRNETIRAEDTITGTVLISAPLIISMPDHLTEVEPDTIELDEDVRNTIRGNLISGKAESEIENHLPMGVRVTLFFSKTLSGTILYQSPDLSIGPVTLKPAGTEGDPGVVVQSETSQITVELTDEELRLFEEPRLFMGARIEILGTAGQLVRFRSSDFVRVKLNLQAVIRTDFEDDDAEGGAR